MSIRNIITENIILPLSDLVLGQSVYKHFKFLQKSQWWSENDLKEYQNEKLRALIKHVYENVPYYTELFVKLKLNPADFKTTKDLHKLPILTKEIVRENMKTGKLIAKNIREKDMKLNGSSGSTGEPLQYYITKDAYSFNVAANLRGWYWMGYRLGDKYIKISQNPRNGLKRVQDTINNCNYVIFQKHDNDNLKMICKVLSNNNSDFIRGYPDPLFFIANYIKNEKIKIKKFKAVNTTGNILFPNTRKLIEEVFNAPVFDSYSSEGGANVFECSNRKHYHSTMEYAISEILSISNNNRKGRLITTDLINYAVPFIRYDSQDFLITSKEKCTCGRNLMAIDRIEGRDSDTLITPAKKYLIVHNFTAYFEWIDSVVQFQVRQDKIDEFNILLKVNEKYTKEDENKIYQYWNEYINEDVKIKITVVDDIPLTKSGKRRFLIRSKDIKLDM
jgi:phenylacetate-CoA ligase